MITLHNVLSLNYCEGVLKLVGFIWTSNSPDNGLPQWNLKGQT